MRDRLVHEYFSVDYYIVWDVIGVHIPKLRSVVKEILRNARSNY